MGCAPGAISAATQTKPGTQRVPGGLHGVAAGRLRMLRRGFSRQPTYKERFDMPTRVVCYGLGPIGLGIARLALTRPGIEIVGAVDIDPNKVGHDLGELLGG